MGLKSTCPAGVIRKDDVSIAKNYLDTLVMLESNLAGIVFRMQSVMEGKI